MSIVQIKLAKGRIIHRVHWASTFASGSRQTMHNALMSRYVTMDRHKCSSKVPLRTENLDPHLIHGSLGSHEPDFQTALRSVQSFLHSSLVCPTHTETDRHTVTDQWDHATCDICSRQQTASMHCVQVIPLHMKVCQPHLTCGFLGPCESVSKLHFDQFSIFAGLTNVTNRQTEHTDRAR